MVKKHVPDLEVNLTQKVDLILVVKIKLIKRFSSPWRLLFVCTVPFLLIFVLLIVFLVSRLYQFIHKVYKIDIYQLHIQKVDN